MTNPYSYADMRHDEDCTDFDAKADYLEESAIDIMQLWTKEIRDSGRIDWIDLDDVEITQMCVDQQLPWDAVMYSLAYKRAEEKLVEDLKWS